MKEYKFIDSDNFVVYKVIEKPNYDGKGYRYSLKVYNQSMEEKFYQDSIHTSDTPVTRAKLAKIAIKFMREMEVI